MSAPITDQPLLRFLRITLAELLFLSLPPTTGVRGEVAWT